MDWGISKRESIILKGVAILSVLLAHGVSVIDKNNEVLLKCLSIYCECGMGIFLFLSGYGLDRSFKYKGVNGFVKNRIFKVMIPVAITEIIVFLTRYLLFQYRPTDYLKVLCSILGIINENVIDVTMWYISYLYFWYAFFWIVYSGILSEKYKVVVFSIISIVGIWVLPKYYSNAIYCGCMFPLGVIYSIILDKKKIKQKKLGFIIPPMIIIWLLIAVKYWRSSYLINNILTCISVFLIIIFIKRIDFAKYKLGNIFYYIGAISFEVYLLEHFILFSEVNLLGVVGGV